MTEHRTSPRRRTALGLGAVASALASLLYAAVPAAAAVTPGGMVSNSWSVSGAPSDGLDKLAFVLNVTSAPDASGYFWAQQYYFGSGKVGYIGWQPRSGGGGRAIFSVFGSGTSTAHANCSSGADGGAGTSCSVSYPLVKGRDYNVEVINNGNDNWTGYMRDSWTGEWTTIGNFNVPSGSGKLRPSGVGFVEYYSSVADCDSIPYGQAVWRKPFVYPEPGTGTNTSAYTYGNCKTSASYSLSNGEVTMTSGGSGGSDR